MITGTIHVKDWSLEEEIGLYYRKLDQSKYSIKDLDDAFETAEVELTGKWRIVGDVDDQKVEVQADIDWITTSYKRMWVLWWYDWVEESDNHGTTVWLSEDDFEWLTPDNEYGYDYDEWNETHSIHEWNEWITENSKILSEIWKRGIEGR